MSVWLLVSTGFAGLSWTVFVTWYAIRAKWWKTAIGRNTMGVSVVVSLSMIRLFLLQLDASRHYTTSQFVWGVLIYSSLAYLGIRRIVLVEQSQRAIGLWEVVSLKNSASNRRWDDPK